MSDLEDEIRELRETTKRNRRQFLRTEVQTCFIAVERGQLALSLGNTHEARKELATATRGAEVTQRFLVEAMEEMPEIETKLAELKKALESLRLDLDRSPG